MQDSVLCVFLLKLKMSCYVTYVFDCLYYHLQCCLKVQNCKMDLRKSLAFRHAAEFNWFEEVLLVVDLYMQEGRDPECVIFIRRCGNRKLEKVGYFLSQALCCLLLFS